MGCMANRVGCERKKVLSSPEPEGKLILLEAGEILRLVEEDIPE
jgi:hypothetical protein